MHYTVPLPVQNGKTSHVGCRARGGPRATQPHPWPGFCSFAGMGDLCALRCTEHGRVGGWCNCQGWPRSSGWVGGPQNPPQPQKHPKKFRLRRKALHWPTRTLPPPLLHKRRQPPKAPPTTQTSKRHALAAQPTTTHWPSPNSAMMPASQASSSSASCSSGSGCGSGSGSGSHQ